MSSYATTTELTARYEDSLAAAFITDNEDSGTPDTTVQQESIDYAEGQIHSYLAHRYNVPVDVSSDTALDALLRNWTLDFAMYHLAATRQGQITAAMQAAHDETVLRLEKIAAGELLLPSASPLTTSDLAVPKSTWGTGSSETDSKRLFTRSQQSRS